ncbi:MAG: hypothetical protein LUD25_04330 [Coriobacteriaceae bacterium]|nr:hypothetical protein [Coriobacteriaceae bacterium]
MSSAQALKQIGDCDIQTLRLKRQLDELPEAAGIFQCRAQRKDLQAKSDQAAELAEDVHAKLAKAQTQKAEIDERVADLRKRIDNNKDFRLADSLTRDLDSQVEQQEALVEEEQSLNERRDKIEELTAQLDQMKADLDAKEAGLTETFKEKGGAIKAQIDEYEKQRTESLGELDDQTAKLYESLLDEKNGIAIAQLEGEHCSACHFTFQEGQLSRLHHGPDVTECPNCHRIMVVRGAEDSD